MEKRECTEKKFENKDDLMMWMLAEVRAGRKVLGMGSIATGWSSPDPSVPFQVLKEIMLTRLEVVVPNEGIAALAIVSGKLHGVQMFIVEGPMFDTTDVIMAGMTTDELKATIEAEAAEINATRH